MYAATLLPSGLRMKSDMTRTKAVVLALSFAALGLSLQFALFRLPSSPLSLAVISVLAFVGPYLSALFIIELLAHAHLFRLHARIIPTESALLRTGLALTLTLLELIGLERYLRLFLPSHATIILVASGFLSLLGTILGEWLLAPRIYRR